MSKPLWFTFIGVTLFGLLGCETDRTPVVAPEAPSLGAAQSKAAAAVAAAQLANSHNPEGLPKEATDRELTVAAAALPAPEPADLTEANERVMLVLAGRLEDAAKRYAAAESEAARLRQQIERERAESEARIKQILADSERRVKAAQEQAEREAYLRVVTVFAGIGGIIAVGGLALALTGWNRMGVLGIPAGILIGGSGLLWGKPWFLWTVGGGVILTCVAIGIWWAVSVYERRLAAVSTPQTPMPTAP